LENEAKKISAVTSLMVPDFCGKIVDKSPYDYEIKKTSEGKCVFLEDNQCRIYRLRPLVCMFYPFELKFDQNSELHTFDFTLECPRINQGKVVRKTDFRKLFELARERLGDEAHF
jgi:Fe-S-cluster containining protein